MTSSYQDPNIYAALAAQKAYEEKKEPTALDLIGGLALGAGIGALAGRGIIKGLRRNAVKPVTVQDLGSVASQAEDTVRAAASAPRPSRPSPGPTVTRQQQAEEIIRQARSERPQGVKQVDLSSINLNDEEYLSPYRKEPTDRDLYPSTFAYERLSPETIQARRQLNAERALNRQLARPDTYQLEIGKDVSPTLRSLRSSEFGPNITETRREALGLFPDISSLIEGASPEDISSVSISTSRPISATPKQFNLFDYLEERGYKESSSTGVPYNETQSIATAKAPAIESGGDAADRLILEFQQLSERQARADQRARSSVREYQMRLQGTAEKVLEDLRNESLVEIQQVNQPFNVDQAINALESGEDQMTGRMRQQLQRNEDLDMGQVDLLEEIAEYNYIQGMEQDEPINRVASQLADGLPVDQAEGLKVLDLRNKQSFQIPPRALGQQQNESQLLNQARQYLLSKEIDTDFDYSTENRIQAAQVQDRIQKAQYLREQADQILADIKAEGQPQAQQVSPQEFAAQFNKKYKEELNDQLRDIDNARQRAELKAAQSATIGEDIESLLLGDPSLVDTTMRGKALRGGKPNITGDIVYQDAAGEFVSADTGLKTRLKQGPEYEIKSRLLNELNTASDEDLTELISKGQQSPMNQYLKNLVTSRYGSTQQLDLPSQIIDSEQIFGTQFDESLARMASNVLRARASRNLEPTDLQLSALDRAKASVAASQEVLKQMRNPRPTVSPGPAQDVARAMETLRRGMVVEPSEPLPVLPSINQLRTGYATDEELGPILGAADVYTGAAAEAAGPVIFTGKSKANSVIRGPRITGSVNTPTGRYLTQDNPDVLGTVYEVAGTRANREISAQVEANAQAFLADALAGGLTAKAAVSPERFVTPGRTQLKQLELPLDPGASAENAAQVSRMSPLSLQSTLGLPGQQPSQRTLYARYQPGRSGTTPLSPFIGDMPGGTVVIQSTPSDIPNTRRDIGTPPGSRIDLTRRGAKARFFPDFLLGDVPQETSVTGMEPAPIGPLTQSPGSPRIGGYQQQAVLGAGRVPTTQLTSIGQRVAYPRMSPLVKAPDYSGNIATNIPLYGIDPGAEDWRNDLMRSAFRRGGPIRTYQA